MNRSALAQPADGGLLVNRRNLPFEVDAGIAARAAIGLIVLASDQTIEYEFRRIFRIPGVAVYESRIFNDNAINPETLKAMESRLAGAADLILPGMKLDVVAYGCTSGAMVIGDERVRARIHEARPGVATTTPMAAAVAAFQALGVRRIALLTPYVDAVNQAMRQHVISRGIEVPVMGSFNEEDDRRAARITPGALSEAALELGRHGEVDGVFVSCTSLRLVEVAADLEQRLGKPVTSSNHAMAWHCLRLAGIDDRLDGLGRLFSQGLA